MLLLMACSEDRIPEQRILNSSGLLALCNASSIEIRPGLKQMEQRLIESLHAVLRSSRGDRLANQIGLFFVHDVVANQSG